MRFPIAPEGISLSHCQAELHSKFYSHPSKEVPIEEKLTSGSFERCRLVSCET